MKMDMEQKQKQVLTPQMIQNANILQMNIDQLSEYMKEIALENPIAELEIQYPGHEEERQGYENMQEWLNQVSWHNNSYYGREQDDQDRDYMNAVVRKTEESLKEVLLLQLYSGGYSVRQFNIFKTIADNLDNNGFFNMEISEFASVFHYTEEESRTCLAIMQELEPNGVCSANLKECLLKQIEKDEEKGIISSIASEIVTNYLELLGKNQLHTLAQKLKCSLEVVKEAAAYIKTLNPRPSQGYDDGRVPVYVVPDITVARVDDEYKVLLDDRCV